MSLLFSSFLVLVVVVVVVVVVAVALFTSMVKLFDYSSRVEKKRVASSCRFEQLIRLVLCCL